MGIALFFLLATVYGKCLLFLNIVNQVNSQPVGNKIGDEYIGLQTGPATWRAKRDLQIGMWQVLISKGLSLLRRLFLGSCKKSKSPHLPFGILKVYIETLTGFSYV